MTVPLRLACEPLDFDDKAIARRVGLILLATDHSTEADFARLVASPDIGVYATRIDYANPTTPTNLRAAEPRLERAAAQLLPGETLDVVCFSCTSASVVIGDAAVEAAIQRGKPGVRVVTPPLAAKAGLNALGCSRISVLTPYTKETSEPMARYFEGHGFEIERFTYLGLDDDREMARISRASLVSAAVSATSREADALFISCTALRSASIVAEIEDRIGRPVVASNQATAWACRRACGLGTPTEGAGRLFELALSDEA